MHVILATVGTDGDVFPHIGLGCALLARGHRVTLAAPEPHRARATDLGLEFCSLITAEEVALMLADPDMWNPFKCGMMVARWGARLMPRLYDALAAIARDPDAVLVANPGLLPARLVQDKLKIPMASLVLQPGVIASCSAPPTMAGGMTIPAWLPLILRRAFWLAVDAFGYLAIAGPLNRLAARVGVPPVRRLTRWWLSPDLAIGLFPSWYAEPQADWPPQLRLAGFAKFDGGQSELADDVRAFCQAGPPPVVFTLGTAMAHAGDFFRTAAEACAAAGTRGLLLTKFPELVPATPPPTVRHCAFAPFRPLLPLCGALVHHGGVGTTAAALEAACPQLVLPLAWDQPDNAARITKLGVGLALGVRQRKSEHMARALGRLMEPAVRERCREVAALTANVNGLETAADWVEQLAKPKP